MTNEGYNRSGSTQDDDTPVSKDDREVGTSPVRRRHLLRGLGAGLASTSLAGCTLFGPNRKEITAKPRGITAEEARERGYRAMGHLRLPVERRVTDEGGDVVVAIENHAVTYDSGHLPNRAPFPLAILTTPSATVGGTERNPFLSRSFEDLLATEDASDSDSDGGGRAAGSLQVAGDASTGPWNSGRGAGRRQGVDPFQTGSGPPAGDTRRLSTARRYQQGSGTSDPEDGDDSDRAGPPIPPLAKLIGPEGLGLTYEEISGWKIPPRVTDESTQTVRGQDVTTNLLEGVAEDSEGEQRALRLHLAIPSDDPVVVAKGRSKIAKLGDDDSAGDIPAENMEFEPKLAEDMELEMQTATETLELEFEDEPPLNLSYPDGPDVAIDAPSPGETKPGDPISHPIEIRNKGEETADTVKIEGEVSITYGEFVPRSVSGILGCEFDADSDSNEARFSCEVGSMSPGDNELVLVEFTDVSVDSGERVAYLVGKYEASVPPEQYDELDFNNSDEAKHIIKHPDEDPDEGIFSRFGFSDEGWTVVSSEGGTTTPEYSDLGHICVEDPREHSVWYWSAPEDFLGHKERFLGGTLSFELKQSPTSNQFDDDDVILEGDGLTLVYQLSKHPGSSWTSYEIPLPAADDTRNWMVKGDEGEPIEAQLRAMFSNLQRLWIRGEYHTGDDTGCLNEVLMKLPPS